MASWFAQFPLRVMFDKDLSETARLLYAALVWWKHDRDQQPTQPEMAVELGISPSKVERAMAELRDAGLVVSHRRGRGKSRGGYSSYFDLPEWDAAPVQAPKRWTPAPVQAPQDAALAQAPTALTTRQREFQSTHHPDRAVGSAVGEENGNDLRRRIISFIGVYGGVFEHMADKQIGPGARDMLEQLLAEGVVEADWEAPKRWFRLPKGAHDVDHDR